jgi:hypothetical protein
LSFWRPISDRHFPQLELLQFGAAFRSAAGDVADATLLYGAASARSLVMGGVHDPASIAALVSDADAVLHVVSPLDEGDIEASMIVPMRVLAAAFDAGVSFCLPVAQNRVGHRAPLALCQSHLLRQGASRRDGENRKWVLKDGKIIDHRGEKSRDGKYHVDAAKKHIDLVGGIRFRSSWAGVRCKQAANDRAPPA